MSIEQNIIKYSPDHRDGGIVSSEHLPSDLYHHPEEYEEQFPGLAGVVRFSNRLTNRKRKEKRQALSNFAKPCIDDISLLDQALGNLDLLKRVEGVDHDHISSVRELLYGRVSRVLEKEAKRGDIGHVMIADIARLYVTKPEDEREDYRALFERIFNAPRDLDAAVQIHYETAWAMVESADPDIQDMLLSILCYENEWFPYLSPCSVIFNQVAGLSLEDDHVKKHNLVYKAINVTASALENRPPWEPQNEATRSEAHSKLISDTTQAPDPETANIVRNMFIPIMRDPERVQKIAQFQRTEGSEPVIQHHTVAGRDRYRPTGDALIDKIFLDRKEPLDQLIHTLIGPRIIKNQWEWLKAELIKEGYEQATVVPVELENGLVIEVLVDARRNGVRQIYRRNKLTEEQKNEHVKQVVEVLSEGENSSIDTSGLDFDPQIIIRDSLRVSDYGGWHRYDEQGSMLFSIWKRTKEDHVGRYASMVSYYRPSIGIEEFDSIQEHVQAVRADIQTQFSRGVGKRGYHLVISDPELRRYGYTDIVFRQSSAVYDMDVILRLNGEDFVLTLDKDFRLAPSEHAQQFVNKQDRAWTSLLVLSHLRALMCTSSDRQDMEEALFGGEAQYECYRSQIVGREEHLRHLPQGHKYSEEQVQLCLKSTTLPVKDLHEINRARRASGDTRSWTYVSASDYVDSSDMEPIRISFVNASEDLRKAISLGEISDEELERMELEILQDLMG